MVKNPQPMFMFMYDLEGNLARANWDAHLRFCQEMQKKVQKQHCGGKIVQWYK
jgi:hypothetical protein